MKRILFGLALLGLAGSGLGQDMKIAKVEDLVWKEHPVFKGAQTVILAGDPMKAEMIVQRTKFPPHYRVPPHTHPVPEVVTVISGAGKMGMGEVADRGATTTLPAGSFFALPPGMAHFVYYDEETVVQITTNGPWGLKYINPKDDPRNAK